MAFVPGALRQSMGTVVEADLVEDDSNASFVAAETLAAEAPVATLMSHDPMAADDDDDAAERRRLYAQQQQDARGRPRVDSTQMDPARNFQVVIRVRPPLPRELHGDVPFQNAVDIDNGNRSIVLSENVDALEAAEGLYATHRFTFDYVFGQAEDQLTVYETSAKDVVLSTLQGYNASIIAYGQTGSGKTYTMEGITIDGSAPGIVPRTVEEIFNYIHHCGSTEMRFLVRASYLQIYNEVISDLLKPDRTNLPIREDPEKGVFVEGLSEWVVRSPEEIYGLIDRGSRLRATGSTKLNEVSSRSHAVFIIITEIEEFVAPGAAQAQAQAQALSQGRRSVGGRAQQQQQQQQQVNVRIGKLNLVDLAGSERVKFSGASGKRLEESRNINQSLSALGNVIAALTDTKKTHIPYRNSKLTRLLEDSLGGNCKTVMMCLITPALEAFSESLSTLKFANRAKNIRNVARINMDLDQKALLRKYERELRKLRQELSQRSKTVVDKRKILDLEEQKKRAERDKLSALRELEMRSREFLAEKSQKKQLEDRIARMQSQLLIGGKKLQATQIALREEHERIRKEYSDKMADLERERQSMEEDKAQVDRYKTLLLKQREIIYALTERLNERNEAILKIQEERDTHERRARQLEDDLDQKNAELIHLQRVQMEQPGARQDEGEGQLQQQQPPPLGSVSMELGPAIKVVGEGGPATVTRLDLEAMVQSEIEKRGQSQLSEVQHWKSQYELLEESARQSDSLRQKLFAAEEERKEAVQKLALLQSEMEAMRVSTPPGSPARLSASELPGLSGTHDDSRVKQLEAKLSSFKSQYFQIVNRLNEKNAALAQLEAENTRLRQPGASGDSGAATAAVSSPRTGSDAAAHYEGKISSILKEKKIEDTLWRAERQRHIREVMQLKQQVATSAKEKEAVIKIMDAKLKPLLSQVVATAPPTVDLSDNGALQRAIKLVTASAEALRSNAPEAIIGGGRDGDDESQERISKMRTALDVKVLGLLDTTQRAAADALQRRDEQAIAKTMAGLRAVRAAVAEVLQ